MAYNRGGAAHFIVGGTTTGRAANILLLDDPLKSREEAESATQRNKVWDFYVSGLSTRLQPDLDGQLPITDNHSLLSLASRRHSGSADGNG